MNYETEYLKNLNKLLDAVNKKPLWATTILSSEQPTPNLASTSEKKTTGRASTAGKSAESTGNGFTNWRLPTILVGAKKTRGLTNKMSAPSALPATKT